MPPLVPLNEALLIDYKLNSMQLTPREKGLEDDRNRTIHDFTNFRTSTLNSNNICIYTCENYLVFVL